MNYLMHNQGCPIENRTGIGGHSDAAMRITDVYLMHRTADYYGCIGKWIACRLNDGSSDNVLYDSKPDAIRFQHHDENWYTFIRITPAQITPCEAEVMLKVARMFYDKGARTTNGFDRRELIKRLTWEDEIAQSKGIVTNARLEGIE
jgi:hypothetical protein